MKKTKNEIDKNKFDPELPCNFEPFAFIEDKTEIKTKYAGKMGIISFGALDYNAHYAPEFGGVALVHFNPDVIIAVKFLPWDAMLREEEHERAVSFLEKHLDIEPDAITKYFHYKLGYMLPAKKEQQRRDYFRQLKEAGLMDEEPKTTTFHKSIDTADGEEIIPLD